MRKISELPPHVWQRDAGIWRNSRRTIIALVAIVLGVVLLLMMNGLIRGSDQAIFGNAVRLYGGNVVVHAPGYRAKVNRLPLLPLENPDARSAGTTAPEKSIRFINGISLQPIVS
jgi:hypothetical protein